MVKYAILGPVELRAGERMVAVGGPQQVALLALLLVNANRALSNDRLIDTLWDDLGPAGALKRLQAAIVRLRRALDPDRVQGESVLRTVAGGYLLAVQPGELDAEMFQARVEEGRRAFEAGEALLARSVLGEALGMWRGPALADVAYEDFAQPEVRRLEELRLGAVEARVEANLRLGEHDAVIGELEALVAAHPGRERLAAQLMLALYRCARQGDALDVFARTRAYLLGELGLEPGPALKALQADILAQSPTLQLGADEAASAAAADAPTIEQAEVLPSGVVTFLLTDVEGSAGLWEADAEAMAPALEFHDRLIALLIECHGGRLLKRQGEGDSTLSVFRRASDAVACAAKLQRDLKTAAGTRQLDLRLRIALHSGEAQERDGDYFGPVLNRAARLRSLATGGVTVLSQSTAELVRDRLPEELVLVDLGRHELRGLSRAEYVFELRAAPSAPADEASVAAGPVMLPLPRSLNTPAGFPFVGREAELARLRERWTVCGGARSAVVIGGEAGIGKTRLASELARTVHEHGGLVLYGRCDEGLAVPYQPFVEALRPYARAVGPDRLRAELGHLAPELGRLLPELAGLGEPIRADPESERFAMFDAVTALIEVATRGQCLLIVLEDLHWAAHPTLLLLRHLIRSERPLGVLVLCTYRETELDPAQSLAQLFVDLHRDASVQRLNIRGLEEPAIAALLEAAVGHRLDQPRDFVRMLVAQTAGNPLFLRELLADLIDSGEHLRVRVTAAELEVPEGLRHVISHRVARLSASARHALSVAAVGGETFAFVLLERVLGERSVVLDALDEAVAAGLLTEIGNGEYAFAHALVRQTIYRQLSSARRMCLHRLFGEALESLDEAHAHVEALAHHFAQAAADGQAVKAAAYALAAGRCAIARLGYEEAAAHYERGLQALTLTRQPQQERRCELLLALGKAHWGAGELDKATEVYWQAAELADKLGDATRLAHAAFGFCGPHRLEAAAVVTRPVAGLLERALVALDDSDGALRAKLMGRLAVYTDVAQRKPVLARKSLEMARRVADKATLADVLASSHRATLGPDGTHVSLTLAAELGRVADEIGDRRLRALAHVRLFNHLLELGNITAAEQELEALQLLAEARQERFFTWFVAVFQASHAHLRGRLEHFEILANDAFAHRFSGHDEIATQIYGMQLFFLRSEQGRLDELMPAVEGSVAQYPQLVGWRYVLAYIYAQLERTAQARQELEALARTDFSDLPRDNFWLSNLCALAEVVAFLHDAPRAELLHRLLLPYADRCIVTSVLLSRGSVSRPLGLLATTLSQYEDAARHFERALKMNSQIGSPLWIAHTQHDYAQMLLLRNRPNDRKKALQLLSQALTSADQLGLRALARKTRPLMVAAHAATTQPTLERPA
jgi:DNA-binding SARP family transcriptional activator/tetratricopeptide (TPR) repeat protein